MPTLFKETIAKNTVEMCTCDEKVFVFHYLPNGDYRISKYDLNSYGLEHALATYNNCVAEVLQQELDKAESEGLYDDGYEFYNDEDQ